MKLVLIFYAIAIVFKFIFNLFKALFYSIKGAFQKKKEPEIPSYSILNKLGNCSKCGEKDVMKDFEGKNTVLGAMQGYMQRKNAGLTKAILIKSKFNFLKV